MKLPELNTDLMLNLILWAERDEKFLAEYNDWGLWMQEHWAIKVPDMEEVNVCGTAFCMAGQAVVQAGYAINFPPLHEENLTEFPNPGDDDEEAYVEGVEASTCVPTIPDPTGRRDIKGNVRRIPDPAGIPVSISSTAEEVLGLTEFEADRFFGGGNDIDELKWFANGFCVARGLPPMFPTEEVADLSWDTYGYDVVGV